MHQRREIHKGGEICSRAEATWSRALPLPVCCWPQGLARSNGSCGQSCALSPRCINSHGSHHTPVRRVRFSSAFHGEIRPRELQALPRGWPTAKKLQSGMESHPGGTRLESAFTHHGSFDLQ